MGVVLPWSRVAALGPDAVMIAGASALGATVMTDGGAALGTVVDVVLEVGADARVVGFEVHGPGVERGRDAATLLIPVDDTLAVSGEALMVPAAAQEFVRDDLSGFGSAVAGFRARLREGAA